MHTHRHRYTVFFHLVRTPNNAISPLFLILSHIITPNQSIRTRNAYFSPHSVLHVEGKTQRVAYLPISVHLPKILGPQHAQHSPHSPNKLPQPKISRGLNWRTKKYCMCTCHRLCKSLTSAHYERRHSVTNTAESSPAVFSFLPYKTIKMAAP